MKRYSLRADQVYAALLYLYPADFRRMYSSELTLLFAEMDSAASARGVRENIRFWMTAILDLISSAARERIRTMWNSKTAALISVLLAMPFLLMLTLILLNIEPAFVREWMVSSDGYSPTPLGRAVMILVVFSLPVAFVINLVGMIKRVDADGVSAFVPSQTHILVGFAILIAQLAAFSQQLGHELRPFVAPLGSAAIIGQAAFLLALLVVPALLLLNRVPRFVKSGEAGALAFQPTSINLIVGAALLLTLMLLCSTFALEVTACSIGVPNCD